MRVRLGDDEARQLTRQVCALVMERLVQAQCGVAFAKFLSAAERLQAAAKAKVRTIPLYDIRGGLKTAERTAKDAHKYLVGGPLAEKALALSKTAGRLSARYKGDGALPPELLPRLCRSVEGLGKDFNELVAEVHKGCSGPAIAGRRHR